MINIYEPYLNEITLRYAKEALDSSWISSTGEFLELAKNQLEFFIPIQHALLCNNGTSATHLMAIGLKYKYPSIQNIIVPNNVYVAAWNAFLMGPQYNLIPIDCDLDTWNIDYNELDNELSKRSPKDTAVLIVHNLGNIVHVLQLQEKYPDFIFLEDNCEGLLGQYGAYKSGSSSLMSSTSFYGNKTLTCGEGGAIFTGDDDLAAYLNSVRCQGFTEEKFVFDKLGYNYRMTNVQAAILFGQLISSFRIQTEKLRVSSLYRERLKGFTFQKTAEGTKHSNWMTGINLHKDSSKLMRECFEKGIETRPMFYPMSKHKHLKRFALNEENANILSKNCLILPSHPNLKNEEIEYICEVVRNHG